MALPALFTGLLVVHSIIWALVLVVSMIVMYQRSNGNWGGGAEVIELRVIGDEIEIIRWRAAGKHGIFVQNAGGGKGKMMRLRGFFQKAEPCEVRLDNYMQHKKTIIIGKDALSILLKRHIENKDLIINMLKNELSLTKHSFADLTNNFEEKVKERVKQFQELQKAQSFGSGDKKDGRSKR